MYAYYKHWKRACWRIWTSEFILLVVYLFWDRVSQWSHCPEIHFVEEAGLELTETELPLPPKGWCERRTPHSAFNLWHGVLSFVLSGYSNITHTVAQLTSSLQKLNFCFWLSSARILGASHHTQPVLFYIKKWICLLYFICMRFCLLDWLCTMCGSGVRGGQKGCPISWNWNYGWPPAGAGSWAWVLCKNNKRS